MRKLSLNILFILLMLNLAGQQNPHGENLRFDCAACHTTQNWNFFESGGFDHDSTMFVLEGQHLKTDCAACHTSLVFSQVQSNCIDCHDDMHNATVGKDCYLCHDANSWIVANITEMHQMSRFPLLGAHNTVDCSACHISASQLEFIPLGVECVDCHLGDYQAATDPNHVQTGFSTECVDCHEVNALSWKSASTISHDFFPLTLGHNIADCKACHISGITGPISPECISCHEENYQSAENHALLGYPVDCEQCHTTSSWDEPTFYHSSTNFPLTGAHAVLECASCHENGFEGTNPECISCHQSDYNGATDHVTSGYPNDCMLCHTTIGWDNSTFDHNTSNFPLTGAHVATECIACHENGYTGTPSDCNACHSENYSGAQDPNHTAAGISLDCQSCHTTGEWVPSIFDHTATTGFELTLGHANRQCTDCHVGSTSGASPDCVSCHLANYNSAKDHAAQNYPLDCSICHNASTWDRSIFDHNATIFPLTGSHITTECIACHSTGYVGTSGVCVDCHRPDYNGTTNPNHSSLGLSVQCEDCHETGPGWDPALFPNHNDYFTLNGAHASIGNDCYLCHNGDYLNTPNTCFACHSNDYNNVRDPNHVSAQFPVECELCHTEARWEPSTFNHDDQYFPIYSGKHSGEWNTCSDCHTIPSNYSSYSCTTCHEHNEVLMQLEHLSVDDYVYNSTSCFECHPTGEIN